MKTLKVSTISARITSAMNGASLAAEAIKAADVATTIAKATSCHGAARAAVLRKAVKQLATATPAAAYAAVIRLVSDKLFVEAFKAAYEIDRQGGRKAWGETLQSAFFRAIRAGAKFRGREVTERVFLGTLNDTWLHNQAMWAEVDSTLERAAWHMTGFGRGRSVDATLMVVRTTNDGKLANSGDNHSEVVLSSKDDPEVILDFLAQSGMSPEDAYLALEELATKGSLVVRTDYNVSGETGDISTHQAFRALDEADKWLRANGGEVEAEVLYHRPASGEELRNLLEDPQVFEDLQTRGASVWADSLPALSEAFPSLHPKLVDQDGNPIKGRKALRKVLSALAIWEVQGDMPVNITVPNDTGSLTASGKYRPGETTMQVSLRERAAYLAQDARSTSRVSSDTEVLEANDRRWNVEIPRIRETFLLDALRAQALMRDSLLMSGLDIPLDSIAYEQVSAALVGLPEKLPEGIVARPVQDADGNRVKDDSGRPLSWVVPFGAAWTPEGELTEAGRKWAKFVLDMRAQVREIDNHKEGVKEAVGMLDSLEV